MERDVKEIIGVLMRVLDGGETSAGELQELAFEADGELQVALNAAYIRLLEFAHDGELRRADLKFDEQSRVELRAHLERIVRAYDEQTQRNAAHRANAE